MPDSASQASPLLTRLARLLEENAPLQHATDPTLGRVISSVLANPGSLFRAALTFQAARTCGLPETQAESLACALEYFHVASLLFDDLPMMDNASIRRGEVCMHLLHGEGAAILAALAFITRAYALTGAVTAQVPAGRQGAALALVERCLGTAGMLNGQSRDLHFRADGRHARDVIAISLAKTVPLIQLSLLLPAQLAGRAKGEVKMLRRLSVYWGLFYQGVDDLSDLLELTENIGKSAQQDQRLGRPNAARQFGLERTTRYLRRLEQIAQRCIGALAAAEPKFIFLQTYHQLLTARMERLPVAFP